MIAALNLTWKWVNWQIDDDIRVLVVFREKRSSIDLWDNSMETRGASEHMFSTAPYLSRKSANEVIPTVESHVVEQ